MDKEKYILLTIDVEDWFQVENFRPWMPFETWDQHELRVERNVHRLLDLFDSIELKPLSLPTSQPQADGNELNCNGQGTTDNGHTKKVHATFFVLGWLAERLPNLVREIHSRGHEVASHGYNHNLCDQLSHSDLKTELADSKKLLEDISGSRVFGCRAPNFSINDDILKIIEGCGYLYDSSYNSFSLNARYGKISLNGHIKKGIARQISNNFLELPISNLTLRNPLSYRLSAMSSKWNIENRFVLPWGGGAYFRLVPFSLFSLGVKNILIKDGAYLFYIHPWEIDLHQPRLSEASLVPRLRHYTNLGQTEQKLAKLIKYFRHCRFTDCYQYLECLLPVHN